MNTVFIEYIVVNMATALFKDRGFAPPLGGAKMGVKNLDNTPLDSDG